MPNSFTKTTDSVELISLTLVNENDMLSRAVVGGVVNISSKFKNIYRSSKSKKSVYLLAKFYGNVKINLQLLIVSFCLVLTRFSSLFTGTKMAIGTPTQELNVMSYN